MKEVLLGKRLKISYKVRINQLNLLPMIPRSLSSRHLHHAYVCNFDVAIAILLGIGGINVLIVLQISFLYIFVIVGRKLRLKIKIEDAFGEKWRVGDSGGWVFDYVI
jgi:hypothetical protein